MSAVQKELTDELRMELRQELQEAGRSKIKEAVAAAIARVNKQYALLDDHGSLSVWNTQPDKSGSYAVYRTQEFEKKLCNQYVEVEKGNETKQVALGSFWMKHPERRDLNGVGFWPEGAEPEGALNLWRGFGCEPKDVPWKTLRRHLLDVICGGDKKVFEYLLKLLAWKVQNPTLRPEVAIVMRSGEGTGKGSFVRIIERWFGNACRHVGDSQHVLGDFNDVLIGALVVFMDEALFANDPRQVKRFMGLVTERSLTLNGKFKPAFSWVNPVMWIVATNNRKAIDAAADARRYLMLEVSDAHVGDVDYFKALHAAIDGEESQGMLHELLQMDLAGWHPRESLPRTDALAQQKELSLKGTAAFIHEVLEKGSPMMLSKKYGPALFEGADGTPPQPFHQDEQGAELWQTQGLRVTPAQLFDAYQEWLGEQRGRMHHESYPYKATVHQLAELLPHSKREGTKGAERRYWLVAPLGECREHFRLWLSGRHDRPGTVTRGLRG